MIIPNDHDIEALSGVALSHLAWKMGLEPCEMIPGNNALWFVDAEDEVHQWQPHADLEQARAVFLDKLNSYGWTVNYWRHGDSKNTLSAHGKATQEPFSAQEIIIHTYDVDPDSVDNEAYGLLLCSCLARAKQLRKENAAIEKKTPSAALTTLLQDFSLALASAKLDDYDQPTEAVREYIVKFLEELYTHPHEAWPQPGVAISLDGDVRIAWFRAGVDIRLIVCASDTERCYIYYENIRSYGVDRKPTPASLAARLRDFNNEMIKFL